MEHQLYLFEILLKDITFDLDEGKSKMEHLDRTKITIDCGNFLNFDIEAHAELVEKSRNESQSHIASYSIEVYTGKSYLFSASVSNLLKTFEAQKISLKICKHDVESGKQDSTITFATVSVKWPTDFIQLVKGTEHVEKVQSSNIEDTFEMLDATQQQTIGQVDVFLSLHSFGKAIQVDFQLMHTNIDASQFKNRLVRRNQDSQREDVASEWLPLFKSPHKERFSRIDPELRIYAELAGIIMPETPEFVAELTPEYINNSLCGKKICPAAIKFKEYGLGPLCPADKSVALGTIYHANDNPACHIKPQGIYGLSQTYGNLDHYGAFGLLRSEVTRCGRDNQQPQNTCGGETCPYVYLPRQLNASGSRNISSTSTTNTNFMKVCSCKVPRLKEVPETLCSKCKQGRSNGQENKVKCKAQLWSGRQTPPFRLRGGADNGYEGVDMFPDRICPLSKGWQQSRRTNPNRMRFSVDGESLPTPLTSHRVSYASDNAGRLEKHLGECFPTDCPALSKQPMEGRLTSTSGKQDSYKTARMSTSTKYSFAAKESPRKSSLKMESYSINIDSDLSLSNITSLYMTAQKRHMSQSMNNFCDMGSFMYSKQPNNKQRLSSSAYRTLETTEALDTDLLTHVLTDSSKTSKASSALYNLDSTARPEKHTPKDPCNINSCKLLQYKRTCSHCGGISRSGATCNDKHMTSTSYSSISYDGSYDSELADTAADTHNETQLAAAPVEETNPDDANAQKKAEGVRKSSVKIKEDTKNKNSRFVYHVGEYYSGIRVGHKWCSTTGRSVPADMGWRWNIDVPGLKRRRGWKPGMLSKIINEKIIQRRQELGIPNPPELKMLVRKTKLPRHREEEDEIEEEIEPKPTLVIEKKNGSYLITLNPLKDPKTIEENENPYINCEPLQFIITKTKKQSKENRPSRDADRMQLMDTTNNNPCVCDRDALDEDEQLDSSSDSSNSELNIEFTPPAGIIRPERMKRKPNEVYTETQFKEDDLNCTSCPVLVAKSQRAKKAVKLKFK